MHKKQEASERLSEKIQNKVYLTEKGNCNRIFYIKRGVMTLQGNETVEETSLCYLRN